MTNKKFKKFIGDDPTVVEIMQMLGFRLGFGDATLDEVCEANGINPELFSALCEIYTGQGMNPDIDGLSTADIPVIMSFLRITHRNYLEKSLDALHESVHRMTAHWSAENASIVNRFFDEYDAEMKRHIEFEENVVFTYIGRLLEGDRDTMISISMLGEVHSNVEEKLEDFKNIVMNYLPAESTGDDRYEVLIRVLEISRALSHHMNVEDKLLMPLAESLEEENEEARQANRTKDSSPRPYGEENRNEATLSDREKQIVAEVARGLTNKEIADKLFISVFTVTTHRKNISRKLGIKTIPGLTVYALMNGLIREDEIRQ